VLIVTMLLAAFTIVFGELVPKTLALAYPTAWPWRSPVRSMSWATSSRPW